MTEPAPIIGYILDFVGYGDEIEVEIVCPDCVTSDALEQATDIDEIRENDDYVELSCDLCGGPIHGPTARKFHASK